MANQWLRLWHDMPTDPKWRTIARVSGRSISEVMAVYCHVLVTASRNVTRGHADIVTEDVASALDLETDAVDAIVSAMQGRVLDGERVSGWEIRQPKKEDAGDPETRAMSAAERKRAQRERERASRDVTQSHEESRDVTLDKDTDQEEEQEQKAPVPSADDTSDYSAEFGEFWSAYPKRAGGSSKKATWKKWSARLRQGVKAEDMILAAKRYAEQMQAKGNVGTVYVKQAETFLGPDEHWRDALNSNVLQFQGSRDGKPALTTGQFYHPMWDDGIRVICHVDTHDEFGRPLGRQA